MVATPAPATAAGTHDTSDTDGATTCYYRCNKCGELPLDRFTANALATHYHCCRPCANRRLNERRRRSKAVLRALASEGSPAEREDAEARAHRRSLLEFRQRSLRAGLEVPPAPPLNRVRKILQARRQDGRGTAESDLSGDDRMLVLRPRDAERPLSLDNHILLTRHEYVCWVNADGGETRSAALRRRAIGRGTLRERQLRAQRALPGPPLEEEEAAGGEGEEAIVVV